MTQAWLTLTDVDGNDIATPSEKQLAAALTELYAQAKKGLTEPGTAALRFGYDDGLMYVAEVSSTGDMRFEEWSDSDCELALAPPRRMSCTKAQALQLWMLMARRQVSKI